MPTRKKANEILTVDLPANENLNPHISGQTRSVLCNFSAILKPQLFTDVNHAGLTG